MIRATIKVVCVESTLISFNNNVTFTPLMGCSEKELVTITTKNKVFQSGQYCLNRSNRLQLCTKKEIKKE